MNNKINLVVLSSLLTGILMMSCFENGSSSPISIVRAGVSSEPEKVTQVCSTAFSLLALTSDGNVYGAGDSDGHKMVGIPSSGTILHPVKADLTSFLSDGERIAKVTGYANYSLALTSEGNMLSTGDNQYGCLGLGTLNGVYSTTKTALSSCLSGSAKFVELLASCNFSLALASDGSVYGWGANDRNQVSASSASVPSPTSITFPDLGGATIKQISAGSYHSLALASDGSVFGWGWNQYGQVGNGTSGVNVTSPTKIVISGLSTDEEISQVSAGDCYSLGLTNQGNIFAWGSYTKTYGFGFLPTSAQAVVPTKIIPTFLSSGEQITSLLAGSSNSFAFTSQGNLYGGGTNANGELGNGTQASSLTALLSPTGLESGDSVVSGSWQGTGCYAFVTEQGYVISTGKNGLGQFGDGTNVNTDYVFHRAELSPDYLFANKLEAYKTCLDYEAAYSALYDDYSGLTMAEIANLSNIQIADYPAMTNPTESDYALVTKNASVSAADKWNAIISLHNGAPSGVLIDRSVSSGAESAALLVVLSLMGLIALGFAFRKTPRHAS